MNFGDAAKREHQIVEAYGWAFAIIARSVRASTSSRSQRLLFQKMLEQSLEEIPEGYSEDQRVMIENLFETFEHLLLSDHLN